MSTPNPLAPQGSLLEQQAKGRSTFQVISFIGAVHVVLLCGILWTACGRDEKPKTETANTIGSDPYSAPATAPDNNLISPGSTNLVSSLPGYNTPAGGTPIGGNAPGTQPAPGTFIGGAAQNQPPPAAPSLPSIGSSAGGPAAPPIANEIQPVAGGGEYKVLKGDTGTKIAKKNGVSLKALVAANPTADWNRLKIGQSLQIPAATHPVAALAQGTHAGLTATETFASADGATYTVKAGDTGTRIAAKHGLKWADLRRANNLKSDALHPGQKLVIPVHAAPGSAPVPASESAITPVGIPIQIPPATQPTAIPLLPRTPPR